MRHKFAKYLLVTNLLFFLSITYAQRIDNSTWKAQISLGVNSPSKSGFIDSAPAKGLNFPTVNLGIQRMFSRTLGAKLDYGFNRFASEDGMQEFKVNYSRINAQLVYNPSQSLTFLPEHFQVVLHAGPGYSNAKPLGNLGDNKQSYLNFILGFEVHYSINRKIALYSDISYIYGFTSLDDYNPEILGLGAFNGNVFNVTFGVSIALSGCYYCD
ncbi:MAG: cell envelope biogenesis protein OmpA [Winogradskyella sp.]|uniref:outer membrane beta-barrel protein n=1 Tax=Winogradskyella sp. TaxID=1883156 RepID=UPI000F3CACA2|nr:outer membrane beta-barrel protein [Winogradskyella sp.]RNC88454.1 MAG: cell envelope biogenesis protein OmpA [Winogradskyella sp.]